MKDRTLQASPAFSRLIERHMRQHDFRQFHYLESARPAPPEVQPFVAISRCVGAGGLQVGRRLAQRLGWSLFEKEILQAMAADDEARRQLYAEFDERDQSWLEEMIRALVPDQHGRDDYFRRLTETVLSLARAGRAVFVGRAADLILPRSVGMRVRITAPLDQRIAGYAERMQVSLKVAEENIQQIDRDREEFIRRHFHTDPTEPTRFDLILNMGRFSASQAVDLIVAGLRCRSIIP